MMFSTGTMTYCVFWSFALVLLLTQLLVTHPMGTTPIEDHLETEIDNRAPNSFKEQSFQYLSVRQIGFKDMCYNNSGAISCSSIGNWEVWSFRYWYETRVPSALCPMTPVGIATNCDWALMIPCLFAPDPFVSPKTIFVHTYMLPHFVESTLNFMDHSYRFVLVSGGSDATIPRSLDPRFKLLRGFSNSPDGGAYYQTLLKDERIIHWFAENHDMSHPKLSTLPTGFAWDGVHSIDQFVDHPNPSEILPIEKRPLKFLLSDRVRTGTGQWADRYNVVQMCIANNKHCHRPPEMTADPGIPHSEFLKVLVNVSFVACVHGGGIDPSPKAWEALLLGTIPIIQHSSLDDGYEKFPVMFINDWSEMFNNDTESLLLKWREKLAPYYQEGSHLRRHVLERLKTSYWIEQFHHKYRAYEETALYNMHHNLTTVPAKKRSLSDFPAKLKKNSKKGKKNEKWW